jgi:Flp pilus assembly protein TadB
MTLLLSLILGLGIWQLYWGLLEPDRPRRRRAVPLVGRARRFLDDAGLSDVKVRAFLLLSICTGVVSGLGMQLFTGMPVVSAGAAVVAGTFPYLYWGWERDRRRDRMQEAMADSLSQMRSSILAGNTVQGSIKTLAGEGPELLRCHFRALSHNIDNFGFDRAVVLLREELRDPLFDTVARALVVSDRVGPRDLPNMLDRMVLTARSELSLQRTIRAQQTQGVMEMRGLLLIPLVLFIVESTLSPDYMLFFRSLPGQLVLLACELWLWFAYWLMQRLRRLPVEERRRA